MENLYMPKLASVTEVIEENPNIRTLTLAPENHRPLDSLPGQFIELTFFGIGEFPVSISGVVGPKKEQFQTTIQKIGKVTTQIEQLSEGAKIGIRGPFGNGFPLEEMKGKDVCLISGGVGLAAVKYLLDHLTENRAQYGKITLLHGAKTPDALIYKNTYIFDKGWHDANKMEIRVTVDEAANGWNGHVGVVTKLLKHLKPDLTNTIAVVCGPSIMMKFSSIGLRDHGLDDSRIFLSMERKMQCGMGLCGHCMIGHKRVCVDGPVFPLSQIGDVLEKIF